MVKYADPCLNKNTTFANQRKLIYAFFSKYEKIIIISKRTHLA